MRHRLVLCKAEYSQQQDIGVMMHVDVVTHVCCHACALGAGKQIRYLFAAARDFVSCMRIEESFPCDIKLRNLD